MAQAPERGAGPTGVPSEARRRHATRLVVGSMLAIWLLIVIIVVVVVS